jgi:hypothetical protein
MKITSEYIRGLVDAEGSFTLGISEKPRKTKKIQVFAVFVITQSGDIGKEVLEAIRSFLKCGKVSTQIYKDVNRGSPNHRLNVYSIKDHVARIIPFFDAHPPIIKSEVYSIWKEAVAIINSSSIESELPFHALTEESMQSLFRLKLKLEELMPSHRSTLHRRGRWRKLMAPMP